MSMQDYLFRGSLQELDPEVFELAQIETERQYRKLILIASESTAPGAVLEALGTRFQNLYAEGYPDEDTRLMTEAEILDYGPRLAQFRRRREGDDPAEGEVPTDRQASLGLGRTTGEAVEDGARGGALAGEDVERVVPRLPGVDHEGQVVLVGEGDLFLTVRVDEKGEPQSTTVYATPGDRVSKEAANVLMRVKYKPGTCAGKPCTAEFPFTAKFE